MLFVQRLLPLLLLAAAPAHAQPGREGAPFARAEDRAEALARADRTDAAAAAFAALAQAARTQEGRAYALLRRAEVLRRGGRAQAAHDAWREAAEKLAGTSAAVRARYHAAVTAYEDLGRRAEALATFRAIVVEAPGSIQAPRALRRLAWERPEGLARIALYRDLYARVGPSPLGPVLLWRCAKEAESARLHAAALACLGRLIRAHPESGLQGRALLRAARIEQGLGRAQAALDLYGQVLLGPRGASNDASDPFATPPASESVPRPRRSSLADEALYGYGEVKAELAHDPRAALSVWRRLVREHPTSRLVDDALRRIARLEADLGRPEAARAAWRRLLEARPASRYAPEARAALR